MQINNSIRVHNTHSNASSDLSKIIFNLYYTYLPAIIDGHSMAVIILGAVLDVLNVQVV